MKIVVFAYNFPHRKSHDFIFSLLAGGHDVKAVVAADAVKLNIPPSAIRTKVRRDPGNHPRDTARLLNVPYINTPHSGSEVVGILEELKPDLGVIGGARILNAPVINQFRKGIINFHPGLIPEARGLDALLWSVERNIPLGVTAHLIDERVDAGRILHKHKIEIRPDDTVFDLSERLYDAQLMMLDESIHNAKAGKTETIDYSTTQYNRKMPCDLEKAVLEKIPQYVAANCKN